jgi:hypothetical protein
MPSKEASSGYSVSMKIHGQHEDCCERGFEQSLLDCAHHSRLAAFRTRYCCPGGAAESELRFRFPRTFLCPRLSNYGHPIGHPIGLLIHGSFIIANNKLLSALAVVETRSKGCALSA